MKYIRDGRAPIPKSNTVSKVMSANQAKNTGPELLLKNHLKQAKLKGFISHLKHVPGRPDICYREHRLAIFVNGCYWHRCPYCKPSMPKTHKIFWKNKFKFNKERDRRKNLELKSCGWRSLTIWECQVKKYPDKCVQRIKGLIYDQEKKQRRN